jgi:hypothetical protein
LRLRPSTSSALKPWLMIRFAELHCTPSAAQISTQRRLRMPISERM